MLLKKLILKKGEDRRIRLGHPWIFSNEIDTKKVPLKSFAAGEEVIVEAHDKTALGIAYVNPHSLIAARIISRDTGERINSEFFTARIQTALALRKQLFPEPFYRLVFSEADGLPGLVIDRFGTDLVVQINTAGMEQNKATIGNVLRSLLPDTTSILLRNDSAIREQEGLPLYVEPLYGNPRETIEIEENKTAFFIPLLKGQKTGWFYDHRLNRARLCEYVKNKEVLDVFSYLGGWGIQAAVAGANQVDCIDASKFACDFILQNAQRNQVENKINVICDDAFDALKRLVQANKQYDVVVLDPPAFVKRLKDKKEGLIAYQRLNEWAIKLLRPNGILVACSCSMHVNMDDLLQVVRRAGLRAQANLQILERGHQGPDHPLHWAIPETDYLKALFLRKMG